MPCLRFGFFAMQITKQITKAETKDGKTKAEKEAELQMQRQLSRVFRHVAQLSERLIHFNKELMDERHKGFPSSAVDMHREACALLDTYLKLSERPNPVV